MKRLGLLIPKYLLFAVLPYFLFSWLLLSVILFLQQASRFSDIFFNVNLPTGVVWQLTIALIPNVIAFTCPMAILVGTVIGLAKMQSDSELVAVRAAGVGNLQITIPLAILGIILSFFAFFVNLKGVPLAAAMVRKVTLETALKKLESPVEPGTFNSEIAGYTIFVRNGDPESGRWKNIFIFKEDPAQGNVRLITADQGRIDFSDQISELVLENAIVTTLPMEPGAGTFASENLGEIRFAIKTRRNELIQRLSQSGGSIEELGLEQLSDYANDNEGKERKEAQILWQRRIMLSITPFLFTLLGTSMTLRFSRGGRGLGILLALLSLISYYLLAFFGEQLARTGYVSPMAGSLIPIVISILVIGWFYYSGRSGQSRWSFAWLEPLMDRFRAAPNKLQVRNLLFDITTGIRDFDLGWNLVKYFVLTLAFLISIFTIFTAFDLWKYAGTIAGGTLLLGKYLVYLLPFVYIQLAPAAAMIGALATYVIKSRQSEIVTWASAGQSVYRLLLPCFLGAALLGIIDWEVQERLLPDANQKQDEIRGLINGRGIAPDQVGRRWVASADRIYSFQEDEAAASDNEKRNSPVSHVKNLAFYQFDNGGARLQSVYRSKKASWHDGRVFFDDKMYRNGAGDDNKVGAEANGIAEQGNPFRPTYPKPSYLTVAGIREQMSASRSEFEQKSLAVALEKRYTTLVLPFVFVLFTTPFAFSLNRKAKAGRVGYAIALWLVFTGISGLFEQFGLNGSLSPPMAVWTPLLIFLLIGVFSLSKVRT
jgi:lipopolysaccharide export LptBFGC system permease protein LptF